MAAAGLLAEPVRFAYYGLEEPPKDEVLAGRDGKSPDRRLRAFLVDTGSGESTDVVVSLTHRKSSARAQAGPGRGRPDADPGQRFRRGGRDHQGGPGVARGHGQAGLPRRQPDQDRPHHRGQLRPVRRRPAPDGPRPRLRPGQGTRPGLGAPDRRRRGLRRPNREEGLQGHRRVRAPGAHRKRRLRRRGRPRPAPDHAQAHRDHPAGRAELHPGRLTRCAGRTGRCGSASTPAKG